MHHCCHCDALKCYGPSQLGKEVSYNQEESVSILGENYLAQYVYRNECEWFSSRK